MKLSILLVARNESRYIAECILSILNQINDDLKSLGVEFILVDGFSEDDTLIIAENLLRPSGFNYKILNNEKLTLSPGWNIALDNASGEFVLRPDVHSLLMDGYISNGLNILENNPEITAVGGSLITKGKSFVGSLNALALSSRVGVGNSSFRTGAKDGFYETCVFGIYRREIFIKVGKFDLALTRHEDNDMHARIIDAGGRLFMCSKMKAIYFCRESYLRLFIQMFRNGFYMFMMPFSNFKAMSARHFAPILLLVALIFSLILGDVYFLMLSSLYVGSLLFIMFWLLISRSNLKYLLILPSILICHFGYGVGQIFGIFLNLKKSVAYFLKRIIK